MLIFKLQLPDLFIKQLLIYYVTVHYFIILSMIISLSGALISLTLAKNRISPAIT